MSTRGYGCATGNLLTFAVVYFRLDPNGCQSHLPAPPIVWFAPCKPMCWAQQSSPLSEVSVFKIRNPWVMVLSVNGVSPSTLEYITGGELGGRQWQAAAAALAGCSSAVGCGGQRRRRQAAAASGGPGRRWQRRWTQKKRAQKKRARKKKQNARAKKMRVQNKNARAKTRAQKNARAKNARTKNRAREKNARAEKHARQRCHSFVVPLEMGSRSVFRDTAVAEHGDSLSPIGN
eukprot:gene19021-biopygen20494